MGDGGVEGEGTMRCHSILQTGHIEVRSGAQPRLATSAGQRADPHCLLVRWRHFHPGSSWALWCGQMCQAVSTHRGLGEWCVGGQGLPPP